MHVDRLFPVVVMTSNIENFFEVEKEIINHVDKINNFLEYDVFGDNLAATFNSCKCIVTEFQLHKTRQVIEKYVSEYIKEIPGFKGKNFNLNQSWVNITFPHGFQDIHSHPNGQISGVIYLSVPEDSGNLEFIPSLNSDTPYLRKSYPLTSGQIAVFYGPSLHRVSYNKSKFQRITLAFNCKVDI